MDWKAQLVSSIEAAVQAGVEAALERYASVEESADETARRCTMWFGEKGRRRIELAEDRARRDPVWAEKIARRHAAFAATSTSSASASVLTACAVRDCKLAARPPTSCSTNCPGRAAASAVSTIIPAAASTPSTVTVAIVPERCCLDLEPATAISTPTSAPDVPGASSTAASYLAHNIHLPVYCLQSRDKAACAVSADIVLGPGVPAPATTKPAPSTALEANLFTALSTTSSAECNDSPEDKQLLACSSVERPLALVAASNVADDYSLVTRASAVPLTLAALCVHDGSIASEHKVILPLKLMEMTLLETKEQNMSPVLPHHI